MGDFPPQHQQPPGFGSAAGSPHHPGHAGFGQGSSAHHPSDPRAVHPDELREHMEAGGMTNEPGEMPRGAPGPGSWQTGDEPWNPRTGVFEQEKTRRR
jgi:hypothetical protein